MLTIKFKCVRTDSTELKENIHYGLVGYKPYINNKVVLSDSLVQKNGKIISLDKLDPPEIHLFIDDGEEEEREFDLEV